MWYDLRLLNILFRNSLICFEQRFCGRKSCLRLGNTHKITPCVEWGIYAYLDEAEYPDRFPIACILKKGHDQYNQKALLECDDSKLENFRIKRAPASKPAEIAAVLLAMAQEQANCLDLERFNGASLDDSWLHTFKVSQFDIFISLS